MLKVTDAQLQCLGKLYDWAFIREYDDGVPQRFLGTNDQVLAPLRQKGLLKINRLTYFKITEMGRRVYDLNYWYRKERLDVERERRLALREAKQRFRYTGEF